MEPLKRQEKSHHEEVQKEHGTDSWKKEQRPCSLTVANTVAARFGKREPTVKLLRNCWKDFPSPGRPFIPSYLTQTVPNCTGQGTAVIEPKCGTSRDWENRLNRRDFSVGPSLLLPWLPFLYGSMRIDWMNWIASRLFRNHFTRCCKASWFFLTPWVRQPQDFYGFPFLFD